ncbi:MAG: DUF349 domain-containing protein [Sphingobacteriaceae bacterium]|nr:DUF349 domain-containing protein [Sphingobacteriaceae bacterium]
MKTDLINQLEELLAKDAGEVAHQVHALQKEYQKLWTKEFEEARQVFVDEGGKAKEFNYPKQNEDLVFENLIEKYNTLKKESDAKLANEQTRNLNIRKEIIAKINDLSQLSDNVGAAIKKLQELQTEWKECGAVSSHKYKEVQAEYSKAIEEFYYNLKIYRDLQEHDLKKNFENKSILIEKLKALKDTENIKETERLIKIYRNEWDELGPVPNDKWDTLKGEYKTALDEVYSKVKSFYHTAEEKKEENLKEKLELIEKIKAVLETIENSGPGKWNSATEAILALQGEWKNVGRTNEKDNEKVWAEFRALCDSFFEKKKSFFAGLNEKFAEARKIKNELIAKAEEIQHSTDWQKTSQAFFKLQEDWKKHPSNGDKEEPKLYKRFRTACNTFFEAKKAGNAQKDAEESENLKLKEELISEISAFVPGQDSAGDQEIVKAFSAKWNAIGHVPIKEKKRITEQFFKKLDELYDKLKIDKKEKGEIQFNNKLERLSNSGNAFDALRKEADYLKKLADEINSNLLTYENNLGFFKHSKGNPLMAEFENKIAEEKTKLEEIKAKRKLVTDELNKIRENNQSKAEAK